MGRAAADSINGRKISFKGSAEPISLKLFDNVICSAGLTETKSEELGYNTGSVIGIWSDRADYHPEVKNIVGKLIYTKPGLKLLGLQLIGEGEVTRYIDPFTQLLKEKKSINSLLCLEHAFTPAHSSPFSPLNYLGYIAINQEKDGIINFSPRMLSSFNGIFIDVREKHEVESKPFPENSINIPFSGIRLKINDFDLEQEIIFVCTKGSRSYETTRLFLNHGFTNVAYLGGGSLLFTELSKLPKFEEDIMMNSEELSLVVIGISHKTSGISEREIFQINRKKIPEAVNYLKSLTEVEGIVIVSTCNRLEFYFTVKKGTDPYQIITDFYCERNILITPIKKELFYVYKGIDVARHLFKVITGLDSMVIGEYQIQGQIKDSYSIACSRENCG